MLDWVVSKSFFLKAVPVGANLMGRGQMKRGIKIFKDLSKNQMTIFSTLSEECYSKHRNSEISNGFKLCLSAVTKKLAICLFAR